jgi:hypothetical protein
MGFKAEAVRFTGEAREFRSQAANGGDAVRNCCANCMSLVFGGELGKTDSYTLYAGSLDEPSAFHPTFAIFAASRPAWAIIPPGFKVYDRMPVRTERREPFLPISLQAQERGSRALCDRRHSRKQEFLSATL